MFRASSVKATKLKTSMHLFIIDCFCCLFESLWSFLVGMFEIVDYFDCHKNQCETKQARPRTLCCYVAKVIVIDTVWFCLSLLEEPILSFLFYFASFLC